MKKATMSAIYSAFVVPGLGQINNRQLKKGGGVLLLVFILFIVGVIKLFHIMNTVLPQNRAKLSDSVSIMNILKAEDLAVLWCLLGAFAIILLYSVIDAFLTGKKIDQLKEGHRS